MSYTNITAYSTLFAKHHYLRAQDTLLILNTCFEQGVPASMSSTKYNVTLLSMNKVKCQQVPKFLTVFDGLVHANASRC